MLAAAALLLTVAAAAGRSGKNDNNRLTTYGEKCTDECQQRGFPFTWCHKQKSRNGTFIGEDPCLPQEEEEGQGS